MPPESERVRESHLRVPFEVALGPHHDAHVDGRVRVLDVERRVDPARHDRLHRRHGLDGARGPEEVAYNRLGAVDADAAAGERAPDGLELGDVAGRGRRRVGVDVVDVLGLEAGCEAMVCFFLLWRWRWWRWRAGGKEKKK